MKNPLTNRFPVLAAGLALALAAPAALAQTTYYRQQASPQGTYTTPYRPGYPTVGGYYPGSGAGWYYDYYGRQPPVRTTQEMPGEQTGAQMQQLQGEVVQTKRIDAENTTFQAALLETDDGRRVVVDLGPMQDLRDENVTLRKGNEVRLRGYYTTVGDHRVFMAHEVRADGQRVEIHRRTMPSEERLHQEENLRARAVRSGGSEEQGGDESSRAGNFSGTRQFNGQIVRTSEVKVPELNDRLLFAQIKTDQGNKVLAMLGPVQELHDLDLHKGEQVSVKGVCLHVGGNPFILTQQLKAQGHTFQAEKQAHEELLRRSTEVKGKVVRTKEIDLPGIEREVLVAVVKGDDGQRYVVGLGTSQELNNMEINKGDQVAIRGAVFEYEGQRVLLGRQLTAHGQTVPLGEAEGNRRE